MAKQQALTLDKEHLNILKMSKQQPLEGTGDWRLYYRGGRVRCRALIKHGLLRYITAVGYVPSDAGEQALASKK